MTKEGSSNFSNEANAEANAFCNKANAEAKAYFFDCMNSTCTKF